VDVTTHEFQEALFHHRNGRLDEAASRYERILSQSPNDFEVLFYFGQLRAAQERLDEAYGLMHSACAHRPDSAEAHFHLGAVLMGLRRPNEAIASFDRALTVNPNHARALTAMAAAQRACDRVDEALAYARKAVEADPALPEAARRLGILLSIKEMPEEAMLVLERAVALEPSHAGVRATLASVYALLDRWEDAAAQCRAALELDPQLGDAYAILGDIEMELGRFDEARQNFVRATELDPQRAAFYCRLIGIDRVQPGNPYLAKLESIAADPSLYREERVRVAFALGKAYADLGEHEQSFAHYRRGNALRRSFIDYSEAETLSSLALTARVFTHEFVEARRGWGDQSELPIFIVGMPRSGTTLIEQILASHRDVFAAGELSDFARSANTVLAGAPGRPIEAQAMQSAGPQALREIGERYVESISVLAPQAQRITDKMPANANFLGLIALALPNARIVHSRRDPVDTCLSCFTLLFSEGQAFTYDLGELGRYYRAYEKLMEHWHAVLPSGSILDVQYEDVVNDLEGQARRIIQFCGLPWDDACLRFYETQRPVRTASVLQVRRPIYRSSVGRWRPDPQTLRPLYEGLEIAPPAG
jgi:tetratricopeptide (TPR) repeat protein